MERSRICTKSKSLQRKCCLHHEGGISQFPEGIERKEKKSEREEEEGECPLFLSSLSLPLHLLWAQATRPCPLLHAIHMHFISAQYHPLCLFAFLLTLLLLYCGPYHHHVASSSFCTFTIQSKDKGTIVGCSHRERERGEMKKIGLGGVYFHEEKEGSEKFQGPKGVTYTRKGAVQEHSRPSLA